MTCAVRKMFKKLPRIVETLPVVEELTNPLCALIAVTDSLALPLYIIHSVELELTNIAPLHGVGGDRV